MKKIYIITYLAIIAAIYLQTDYIVRLHRNYIQEESIKLDKLLQECIDKELTLRMHKIKNDSATAKNISIRRREDMSKAELDSLKQVSTFGDTLDIEDAKKRAIGGTTGEIINKLFLDYAAQKGYGINLSVLDSIYINKVNHPMAHQLSLYAKDTMVVQMLPDNKSLVGNYRSRYFAIGTKGDCFIRLDAQIEMNPFIRHQLITLALSAAIALLILCCLIVQLYELHRKDKLLKLREENINGTIHDLKTPLNALITMLSWLQTDEPNVKRRETMELCQTNVKHLIYHIESLLFSTKRKNGKPILRLTSVEIVPLIQSVKREMDVLYQDKLHTISINDCSQGVSVVYADYAYIQNVVRNLLENSLKYSDEGVAIHINLTTNAHMLTVEVEDNGWGIPQKYRRKLFTQFYRVPRKKSPKGFGIGLSQSKLIINEHGGEIHMCGSHSGGCLFSFTLPLLRFNDDE